MLSQSLPPFVSVPKLGGAARIERARVAVEVQSRVSVRLSGPGSSRRHFRKRWDGTLIVVLVDTLGWRSRYGTSSRGHGKRYDQRSGPNSCWRCLGARFRGFDGFAVRRVIGDIQTLD